MSQSATILYIVLSVVVIIIVLVGVYCFKRCSRTDKDI